eukprot:CAMPEP_0194262450 /NCGR_PEP_ID=MMETSP0158-20130606/46552_1 /TAXON_ID=33649 /ORGANISM="Thalassionema nitzschioides, Strain L26-B" /LENGTH=211 /DNA_ID=CAMNT_0039002607 /DNA_START=72 /DNA_END=705 /DNA_ORIENTATION=-
MEFRSLTIRPTPMGALLEKDVDFQHEIIDLNDKPEEFLAKYKEASGGYGSGLVPLLEHGDNLVIESDVIAKYVAQNIDGVESDVVAKYVAQNIDGVDGKGDDLYPDNEEDIQQIDKFVSRWQEVTDTYYDLLRASSQKKVTKLEPRFVKSLANIEDLLQYKSGNFILGDNFSYAECIAAPWIQRFYVTMPYFRGIDFDKDILSQFEFLSAW